MALPSPVTWGVEFEFVMPDSYHGVGTDATREFPDQASLRALALYMHEQLNLPVAVTCQCEEGEPFSLACNAAPPGFHLESQMAVFRTPPQHPPFRVSREALFFFLSQDHLLDDDHDEDWEGLEISTPARGMRELQNGIPEIRGLVRGLSRMGAGLCVTDLCGMHIHVGDQEGGLTNDLAKRIVTLVVLLEEDLFIPLVSPDRQDAQAFLPITHTSRMAKRAATMDPSSNPILTRVLPPGHQDGRYWARAGRKIGNILQLLWQCPNLVSLRHGLNSDTENELTFKSSFNIVLRTPDDPEPGQDPDDLDPRMSTVEFRYPQMTFDCDYVQMWVRIATRVMEVAQDLEGGTYQRTVISILRELEQVDAPSLVPQLLRALGIDAATINGWRPVIVRQDNGQDPSLEATGDEFFRKLRTDL
ncbi:hypothetical protein LIA77_07917 [Sarocladium implicatum]|nr:hypothetical protein LIA77_07917 [Sarocladium implicatum]